MKRLITLIIFAYYFVLSGYAQVDTESTKIQSGGFGSVNMGFKTINNSFAMLTGGGGGFIAYDVRIGVFFNGLTNSFSQKDAAGQTFKLGSSYGGLWVSYPFYTKKDYHPIIDVKAGYGSMRLINTNWVVRDNNTFMVFSAGAGLEYKLSEIFYVTAGLEYIYNYFLNDLDGYSSTDFDSFGVFLSFKLGSFHEKPIQ
jgi:hypothetical protein